MEEQTPAYTEAQKRATQKYRENNKDKVNEQRKKYYQERKDVDPHFLEYKRIKAKEYYRRKKEALEKITAELEQLDLSQDCDPEITEEDLITPGIKIQEDIAAEVIEKPKRGRKKKTTDKIPEPQPEPEPEPEPEPDPEPEPEPAPKKPRYRKPRKTKDE